MIFFEPTIDEKDYASLLRLSRCDLPSTYNEWLYLLNKERARVLIKPGNSIRALKVDPDEFAAHCRATGTPCDLQSLQNFAGKKAGLGQ